MNAGSHQNVELRAVLVTHSFYGEFSASDESINSVQIEGWKSTRLGSNGLEFRGGEDMVRSGRYGLPTDRKSKSAVPHLD